MSGCTAKGVPFSNKARSLVTALAEPSKVLAWNVAGLPADDLSVENALLVVRAQRWPLMVDPQGQMNVSFSKLVRCILFILAS